MRKLLPLLLLLLPITAACTDPLSTESSVTKPKPKDTADDVLRENYARVIVKDYPNNVRCWIVIDSYNQGPAGISCLPYQASGN